MSEKTISAAQITAAVAEMCISANRCAPEELLGAVARACEQEESTGGREVLQLLQQNYATAAETGLPMCQDTGLAVVMVELGQEVCLQGNLEEAINAGVRQGYGEGHLRKSVVSHPLRRVNTGDNTPATIHLHLVPGNEMKLTLLPKGGGSENAGALKMLKPSDGRAGVIDFVVSRIAEQGVNACPPLIIGVGIGGNFEGCALLAKQALLRPLGQPNSDADDAALEAELLERINALGIGPAGYGGTVTALAVHVETAPCHIASLPCAVNVQCNAHRKVVVSL
ncbi:MAG: fumarate hydratase [bacterium]